MNIANCIITLLFQYDQRKRFGPYVLPQQFYFQLGFSINFLPCQSSNFVFGLVDTVRELLCQMTQSKWSCIRRITLIASLKCMLPVLTTN